MVIIGDQNITNFVTSVLFHRNGNIAILIEVPKTTTLAIQTGQTVKATMPNNLFQGTILKITEDAIVVGRRYTVICAAVKEIHWANSIRVIFDEQAALAPQK